MSGAGIIVAATIVGTVIAITTLWLQLTERSRNQASELEQMKQALRVEGKAAMQPMIDLLTSQRDDAREQLKDTKAENAQLREWLHDKRPGPGGA